VSVKRALRFRILQRDKFTCQYCGRKAPDVTLQVDHILPVSLGGKDSWLNLLTACYDCNMGKLDGRVPDDLMAELQANIPPETPKVTSRTLEKLARIIPMRRVILRRREDPPLPIGWNTWPHEGSDAPVAAFMCGCCGMVNTFEGDHCSCRRNRQESSRATCLECSEVLEYDEEVYCENCQRIASGQCLGCEADVESEAEYYCAACLAPQPRFRGGVEV